ncbi:MAG: glycoside hydrolase family 2 protein [Bacteroidia bacterium]|nr:glycoside hydrolase family 2 protein [Bacteroidia bacterium]
MKHPLPLLACALLLAACAPQPQFSGQLILQDWSFRQAGAGEWLPATVPGSVHSDLARLGRIPDFTWRTNEDSVQWIENQDWEYRTTFWAAPEALAADFAELDFDGLDTYAAVYLNDSLLLRSDNMHRAWAADCKRFLRPGANELRVYFRSTVQAGLEKVRALPYLVPATNELAPDSLRTGSHTRKAPYHFGWDWGPRIVGCGIWRPVHFRTWKTARITDLRILTESIGDDTARYTARIDVEAARAGTLRLSAGVAEGLEPLEWKVEVQPGHNRFDMPVRIPNPQRWWPAGMGAQPLYEVQARLHSASGLLDEESRRIGVRALRLVHEPDSTGHSFYVEVNGLPVFMKGSNYIPPRVLNASVTREDYVRVLQDALDANMNMLRVWGGAVYEHDLFYSLCDEKGILIWQDFMFACAMYPGDSAFLANVRREAEDNVKRLRHHPSLALYCGNNENLVAWHNWGWQDKFKLDARAQQELWTAYEQVFYRILPEVIGAEDHERFFWPSSPSSTRYEMPKPGSGDDHDWKVWFSRADFDAYGRNPARFVSEYGVQSYPDWRTIEAFSAPEDWDMNSPIMRHRQRGRMSYFGPGFDGNDLILEYTRKYYPDPRNFKSLVYLSQLMHADALQAAIDAHRQNMPATMGSLYWQIDDCWPTQSWSTVDYYGRWKAAHYRVRDAFAPVRVIPVQEGSQIRVYGVSDRLEPVQAELELVWMDFGGQVHWRHTGQVQLDPQRSSLLFSPDPAQAPGTQDPARTVLAVILRAGGQELSRNVLYLRRPKDLALDPGGIETRWKQDDAGPVLELTSKSLQKGVWLSLEGADARWSDNYFDLLPGEIRRIRVQPADPGTDPAPLLRVRTVADPG